MKIKIVLISMSFFFGTQLYGQLPKGFLSKIKTPSFQVQKGKSYKLASAELMPFKELIANKSITVENKTKSKPVSPNSKLLKEEKVKLQKYPSTAWRNYNKQRWIESKRQ